MGKVEIRRVIFGKEAIGIGDRAGELIAVEMKRAQVLDLVVRLGNGTSEVVEGQVEITEVGKGGEELGDGTGEVKIGEADHLEVLELGKGLGDGAGDVGEVAEDEGLEIGKVGDGRGDLTGEFAGENGEGNNAVSGGVAVDAVPVAAVAGRVPRSEDVGIVEGLLDGEEDFFVVGVTFFSNTRRG